MTPKEAQEILDVFEIERYEPEHGDGAEMFEMPFTGITYTFHDEMIDSRNRRRYQLITKLWRIANDPYYAAAKSMENFMDALTGITDTQLGEQE